jgi:hypothetical protein
MLFAVRNRLKKNSKAFTDHLFPRSTLEINQTISLSLGTRGIVAMVTNSKAKHSATFVHKATTFS